MRKIFLLRGAPGSGKSSFIARHHLQPYAISRDEIRLLLADLTVYYEESTDHLHQVIPRHVTVRTEQMVDNLVQHKMAFSEHHSRNHTLGIDIPMRPSPFPASRHTAHTKKTPSYYFHL